MNGGWSWKQDLERVKGMLDIGVYFTKMCGSGEGFLSKGLTKG